MLLMPDAGTAFVDPVLRGPDAVASSATSTIRSRCEPYIRDPRYIAQKAEEYLKTTGIADTSLLGSRGRVLHLRPHPLRPERARAATTTSTRDEGIWNTGRNERARTWATGRATRRATSRSRRSTGCRTCARRSCSR